MWKRPLPEVFRDEVMTPIGAGTGWRWISYRDALVDVDGRKLPTVSGGTRWGGGVWMNSRDAARFGLLFLRRGQWGSRTVVSQASVGDATTPRPGRTTTVLLVAQHRAEAVAVDAGLVICRHRLWRQHDLDLTEHDLVVVWRWHQGNGAEFFARVVDALAP